MMNEIDRFRLRRIQRQQKRFDSLESREDEQWITIGGKSKEGEKTGHGKHILIDDDGTIKAGAGGKFNGKTLKKAFGGSKSKGFKRTYETTKEFKEWKSEEGKSVYSKLVNSGIVDAGYEYHLDSLSNPVQNIIGKTLTGLVAKYPLPKGGHDNNVFGKLIVTGNKKDDFMAYQSALGYKSGMYRYFFAYNPYYFSENGKKFFEETYEKKIKKYEGDAFQKEIDGHKKAIERDKEIIAEAWWADKDYYKKEIKAEEKEIKKLETMRKNKTQYNALYHFDTFEERLESIVCHEFGHYYMWRKVCHNREYVPSFVTTALKNAKADGSIYEISEYASTKACEFFAEAFSMHVMGKKVPPIADAMLREAMGDDYEEFGGNKDD